MSGLGLVDGLGALQKQPGLLPHLDFEFGLNLQLSRRLNSRFVCRLCVSAAAQTA